MTRGKDSPWVADARTEAGRVVAVDALRGLAILLLIVDGPIRPVWISLPSSSWISSARQFWEHAKWHGYGLLDLGFPGFVLLMGISLRLSADKAQWSGRSRSENLRNVVVRSIALLLLGIFSDGGLWQPWPQVPLAGVLQRLSICYLVSGVFVQLTSPRTWAITAFAMLVGYWAALALIPVPYYGAADFSPEGNLVAYVDHLYLPGEVLENGWHPEGILGTFPAIATCMIGTLMGEFLLRKSVRPSEKSAIFVALGLAAACLAWIWHDYLPINKRMWTPSFALLSAGYGSVVLGVTYQITDVWHYRCVPPPLVSLGRHSLFAYVALPLIRLDALAQRFVGGDIGQWLGKMQPAAQAAVQVICGVAIVTWFDRLQRRAAAQNHCANRHSPNSAVSVDHPRDLD